MPNFISENQIEKAILEVFVNNLGYRHINAENNDTTGRANEQEIVIKPILRERLQKLNKGIPDAALEDVLEDISDQRNVLSGLMANKEVYSLLKEGKEVTFNNAEGRRMTERVRIIDFEDETQNDYLVVSNYG